jgi:hypothetical protein
MASITNKKTIFFVTSPRSPHKLIDEVKFLVENFSGQEWNTETQIRFYEQLSAQPFFEGTVSGDLALKARDRITRAPKALGIVDLKPTIQLTEAGRNFLYGNRPEEAFLRQLLKFQLSSPYHTDRNGQFNVKPYLELMRLVHELEGLSKNEIALFVIGMTHHNKYDLIRDKILAFRNEVRTLRERRINYKAFVSEVFHRELSELFREEIESGEVSIRETDEISLNKFIKTKRANHNDYADASIRYLRATGLFSINPRTFKIYVMPEKVRDVEYILSSVPRDISIFDSEETYGEYLFAPQLPALLTDNRNLVIEKIVQKDPTKQAVVLAEKETEELKDIYYGLVTEQLSQMLSEEQSRLRTYEEYDDILQTFDEIEKKEIADPPLFFEWNIWRAFTMLNDGEIQGNFKVDDNGVPLYTAPGNTADISCRYQAFETIVEVTMSSGHKQYEMEGEPVARHYGNHKRGTDKDVYCIFIAPKLSNATIAYYFTLYRLNIEYYGGSAKIIPLSLDDFKALLKNAYQRENKPNSEEIRRLWSEIADLALTKQNETEWYNSISQKTREAFVTA